MEKPLTPTPGELRWMHAKIVKIRHYEETMAQVYLEGKLPPKIQKRLAFDIGSDPVPVAAKGRR